jgi:3-phenylpropionate/cinnamic acid dioxygenase small subunit
MSATPSSGALAAFVYTEARLLDERRYDAWLDLFAEDGRYWVPMSPEQTDFQHTQSILVEDKLLLRARIERLRSGKAYSDMPPARCQHVLQAPAVDRSDAAAGWWRLRTPFIYTEFRRDEQRFFTGTAWHTLREEAGALKIVEKRVDLLNAGGALPAIYLMP